MGASSNTLTENPAAMPPEEEYVKVYTWKDSTFFLVVKQFFRNKVAVTGMTILLVLIVLSVIAPLIAPYNYTAIDPINANQGLSLTHLLGTDIYGRDILSRILWGGRYSLSMAFIAEGVGIIIGICLGALAGYFPGKVESVIMRFCDIIQNIPDTLLCICISQALGGGFGPTVMALSVGGIAPTIRNLRAQMLNVREQEFVEAAKAINCSNLRVMFRHIVPNSLTPVIIQMSMGIGGKIMASAGLSYLGLGIQEPVPEWGAMIAAGRQYFRYYPHLIVVPGIFVALTVLSFNLVGDGLRDALDPKLRS